MFNYRSDMYYDECIIKNRTTIVFQNSYEGIPDTLFLNFVFSIVLIMFYSLIRRRVGLIRKDKVKKRWTLMFYSTFSKVGDVVTIQKEIDSKQKVNLGLFSWIIETLKLNKQSILSHCGPDALFYLSFQQHLMFVMMIITCVSTFVVLPVNFQGTMYITETNFGRTTLSNLDPKSELLWFHVIIAILYIPMILLIMYRAVIPTQFLKTKPRAIMITNINIKDRNKLIIRNYLQKLFPNIMIEDIQFAYDIEKLILKFDEYEKVVLALKYCENNESDNKHIFVRPKFCSCKKTKAYEYYLKEEIRLSTEVQVLKNASLSYPLGICFVTLSTAAEAGNIISFFKSKTFKKWSVIYAPTNSDLYWENLNASSKKWYLKWYIVNIGLFLILFFITTPAYIMNTFNILIVAKNQSKIANLKSEYGPIISHFLPTIILLGLKVLMPVLVSYSETLMFHWTKSYEELIIMTKTFGYLLFMILILPSLGLTSIQAFLEWTISGEKYRWKCIFLPDKGAFFVNYVITSAFIGNLIDLIRFPDLLLYAFKKIFSKSEAETPYIRKTVFIQYPFGVHYAWILLNFTLCTVYSLVVPLITPFGIIYLMLKYFCDKHNLYFVYGPTNMIDKSAERIHKTAGNLTKISIIMTLIILTAFIAMRAKALEAKGLVLLITILATLFLFWIPIFWRNNARENLLQEKKSEIPPYISKVFID